ncbi:hypothetical protein DLAC_07971 [Tieghemostelium lacteum]|uniref:RING-type E3 ubiquitin transferase n=1 Tax=Tieghemostelium lacteum TaxID=361077 RepID=A0A151ZAU7_TIELA|nr:hypothetical protein DLAC_07971 [Tieghemostelium lacteum]|eukprot:KYQ91069.1 hypothetical protein DLAC_07971 [Tieghemostelium lacteum]
MGITLSRPNNDLEDQNTQNTGAVENNNEDLERGGELSNATSQDDISLSSISSLLPQIYSTEVVKSLINIHRETIRFERLDKPTIQDTTNNNITFSSNATNSESYPILEEKQVNNDTIIDATESSGISDSNEEKDEQTTTTTTTTTTSSSSTYLEGIYNLKFSFDSEEECIIDIYLGCTEDDQSISKRLSSHLHLGPYRFPKGLSQQFQVPTDEHIDLSRYSENDILTFNIDKSIYPVVISLKTVTFEDSLSQQQEQEEKQPKSFLTLEKSQNTQEKILKAQLTFLTLLQCNDKTLAIKPLKQKTFLSSKVYIVHDIYGIESLASEDSKECVACLNDPKEVLAIPCRHFCLCNKCAEILRKVSIKCPICRSPIRALLKIDLNVTINGNSSNNNNLE